ncbi:MAG TPA: ArsB/NhaD family transporter [Nocardioides sp.]|uniref:SLC13 family permease n=1 Tax=Nocardioides sp. TaxID=35761 RepID=UPI002E36C3E8|nr:ArsB/NhaD family transporter [Nocardioides sp.]HEX5088108.1 ArsB/NhaD family transporter [Nocardioides sp.]
MSATAMAAVLVFSSAYVLIATEKIHRVKVALGGAVLMFLIGATTAEDAFFDPETGIDWNVIFLLLGMMLIVAVLKRTGVFEYVAIWSVKRAKGRPFRVMVILVVVTAVASAALDNVTTVLLIAPVTFLVCDRLAVPVVPYLIAEALASNIGGTATLVGDPPNIIIASRAGLTYVDFLVHLAPLVVVLMVVFIGLCRLMFASAFTYDETQVEQIMALNEREAIRDRRLLAIGLTVLALVTVAFIAHAWVHLEPAVVALVGGLVLLAVSRVRPEDVAQDVEWPTLMFFAGLFIMVGALVNTGVIEQVSQRATDLADGRLAAASVGLLWGSAVISALVDNIPYVATMSPVTADLVAAEGGGAQAKSLWWSLALGADLGGNATAVGASANVIVIGLAEKAGHKITFWGFTKYGLVVAVVTLVIATPYVLLRYFALS